MLAKEDVPGKACSGRMYMPSVLPVGLGLRWLQKLHCCFSLHRPEVCIPKQHEDNVLIRSFPGKKLESLECLLCKYLSRGFSRCSFTSWGAKMQVAHEKSSNAGVRMVHDVEVLHYELWFQSFRGKWVDFGV